MLISAIHPAEMIPVSHTAEYALRAVIEIGSAHPNPIPVATLAASLAIPPNYLAKTLSALARAGVLVSARGPNGGFRLGDAPERITLERITAPFGEQGPRRCLLGTGTCGENPSCPVHERWLPVAVASDRFFRTTTIADLTTRGPGAFDLRSLLSPSSPNPSSHT
jgi:Rrf2 family iron-sulfur cluster assembly transcriptional regulator